MVLGESRASSTHRVSLTAGKNLSKFGVDLDVVNKIGEMITKREAHSQAHRDHAAPGMFDQAWWLEVV